MLLKAIGIVENIKDNIPFDISLFVDEYQACVNKLTTPKQLIVRRVSHSYANNYVLNHHYLKRKIYIARNVSYGLFIDIFCVGVAMYGFPVWQEYPGLCPPHVVAECPELIRLCTMGGLPQNTESYFLGKTLKLIKQDWETETNTKPFCVTSFCDLAFGFNGAIYRATNFVLHRITEGRPTNPGGAHGRWGNNFYKQKAQKAFYVYYIK
jgi:hypothetical protein